MLPFAIQFSHAFENHDVSDFNIENKIITSTQETNCAVYHDKFHGPAVQFSSNIIFSKNILIVGKEYSKEDQNSSRKPILKSSRAPPSLLL